MKVKSSGTSRTARFTVGNRRTGQLETVDLRGVTALRRERQRAAGEIEQHIQGTFPRSSLPSLFYIVQASAGKLDA